MTGKNFLITTDRLENFSDGVFTIVLTLLAFQFKVPKFSADASLHQNFRELLNIAPHLIGFIFSFLFVAVFWVNHHHLYRTIKEANSWLLWHNIHSLFWVTMMPIAISMVGDHPRVLLVAIFLGAVLFMTSVSTYFLLRYSYLKSRLADETLSYDSIRSGINKNIFAIVLSLIGIFSAFVSVYISYIIYFVVLGIFMIPQKLEKNRRGIDRRETVNQNSNTN